ncbi:universal stress protein [Nitrincola tapanii]|uniref:Universal stress protein n=1 Tax=Nitrincola tapanii TaxID=1708751 RepID=A0A5A9W717_9GAMM|nr:universal stress protein [Nitrincola tapanii]KAA0876313.1 universal stress protein [Nitrincola tapanii]
MSKVIACIDTFNHMAETVCDYAAWASQKMKAPLTLLHALEKPNTLPATNLSGSIGLGTREHLLEELAELDQQRSRLLREQGRLMLEEAQQRVLQQGISESETLQRHGTLQESLTTLEAEIGLLVMGREGCHEQPGQQHVGTHLESVIRTLHHPILVTVGDFVPPKRFMVAYDASQTSRSILERIAASPLLRGIPCTLLLIGANTEIEQSLLDEAAAQLAAQGFEVNCEIRAGEVAPCIQQAISDLSVDLLVMGAYGHSRIRQFLVGSTTTKLLQKSQIPLLILR